MKEYAQRLTEENETIRRVSEGKEVMWINDDHLPFEKIRALCSLVVSAEDIAEAEARLVRFAPFIRGRFADTVESGGIIESPLRPIPAMQRALGRMCGTEIPGRLFLKMDSHLPVAGSVKARGGIYEVLKHAEDIAVGEGMLSVSDSYEKLLGDEMRSFFSRYTIQVGSTGNLGLSIGISGAALGFHVRVHMSADAKQWKKDLLRSRGVEVLEYDDDYSRAVEEGRRASERDPHSYFIDDERSKDLFLGYAVAAERLRTQLQEQGIAVDRDHPLFVYIPAGVGGAPGGICYGLKQIYGDNVHCFFTEPVMCPSLLLGFASGRYEKANVKDFGLSGITEADGLACASPSGFAARLCSSLVSGEFTVSDSMLYEYLRALHDTEGILIEPSSCAAFAGPTGFSACRQAERYRKLHGLSEDQMDTAVHICWATGGRLVPENVWNEYLSRQIP